MDLEIDTMAARFPVRGHGHPGAWPGLDHRSAADLRHHRPWHAWRCRERSVRHQQRRTGGRVVDHRRRSGSRIPVRRRRHDRPRHARRRLIQPCHGHQRPGAGGRLRRDQRLRADVSGIHPGIHLAERRYAAARCLVLPVLFQSTLRDKRGVRHQFRRPGGRRFRDRPRGDDQACLPLAGRRDAGHRRRRRRLVDQLRLRDQSSRSGGRPLR